MPQPRPDGVAGILQVLAGAVTVPLRYPTTMIYVDESGAATRTRFFVVGALKVRRHGEFSRGIRAVRDRNQFHGEFHFSEVTRGVLPAYYDLVDTLATSDVQFHASVVDRHIFDPAERWPAVWEAHANVTAQLLRGCINRRELVTVLMDSITTPADVAFEDLVRATVNRSFRNTAIVNAALLDSKASDGLQAVDVLAGALAWERRAAATGKRATNEKAKVADRVRQRFNIDFSDRRSPRTNIVTLRHLPGPRLRPSGGFRSFRAGLTPEPSLASILGLRQGPLAHGCSTWHEPSAHGQRIQALTGTPGKPRGCRRASAGCRSRRCPSAVMRWPSCSGSHEAPGRHAS